MLELRTLPVLLGVASIGGGAVLAAAVARDPAVAQADSPSGPVASFGEHPAWDDGKAEICLYDAEEIVEGELRRFEAASIVVAEHFDLAQMVKKEQFDLSYVPVLKCNWFLSIPTGVYRYQQMASLFLRRSDLLVLKAAFSNQEWCGTTFAVWRRDRPGFEVRSYWDGEADRTHELDGLAENALFYEQVPLWTRGRRPQASRVERITLIGKRLGSAKCPPPKLSAAAIWFDGVKGEGPERRIEARLVLDKHVDTMVLAPDFPHTLLEWRRSDSTTWKLRKSARLDYWNYSRNEFADELADR